MSIESYYAKNRSHTGIGFLGWFIVIMAMVAFYFGSYWLGMSSLTEDVAQRAAEGTGLTEIVVGPAQANFLYFQCGNGDTAHRDVTGMNAQGSRVEIVVCGGWLKGATVRYP